MILARLSLLASLCCTTAALAQTAPPPPTATPTGDTILTVTADRPGITARQRAVPPQLSLADRAAYAQIFRDIEAGRFAKAEAGLDAVSSGLLTETARAQLFIARGIGKASRADMAAWLTSNRDLPQAPRIMQMASRLPDTDATPFPSLPLARPFRTASLTTRPELSSFDMAFAAGIKPLVAADRNAEAEDRLRAAAPSLSNGIRTEWAQRIAWSYYSANDNAAALQLGIQAAQGLPGPGHHAALGAWTAGLAAFRTGKYDIAAKMFDLVDAKNPNTDLASAAGYWASRAWLAAGVPENVVPRLEIAATRSPNSFYGLLGRRALGLAPVQDWAEPDFITADWNVLKALPGARRAAALIEIGQIGLGDRELRFLAQTAPETAYPALLRLAARLGLPATQYQLAVRPPIGIEAPLSARYPAPDWMPARGWRVDRGLVFAHALQESTFITTATSKAGAKGLMQLMPGTARQVKAEINSAAQISGSAEVLGDLTDPAFNIEVGQTYLENLRDMGLTQGLLPKVVAAYNAGPGSVQRWNTALDDRGDALLFIESIPFKETRHYVEVVIRNFWMYQLRDGTPATSMDALAAGLWPRFPGMPGPAGIKRTAAPFVAPANLAPLPPPPPSPMLKDEDDIVTADSSRG